ncbi:aminotransferase class I/II-fold pyridoxal phosphate-dependent enzyme [Microbacterium amylolyticum]|uniref:Histidinol-phosphate aminotransferase n=1 Tax=Microbacterium amylolyticum TaxID=936337 RepID=A0ABS4ZHB8_9MICO|nr:aminotransferase class I/II-fold pyridoxal phosphate-dependent enzyme [Microbacterium amylolyticum]MBP2436669.1 histidinol-phosphate aminotransferase [Microbacterium amylolyticum]
MTDRLTFRAAHDQISVFERARIPEGVARACFNEPHFPPLDGLAEVIAGEVPHLNEYGGRTEEAVAAIAAAHRREPDEVLLGSGSMDLIRAVIASVCEPGDDVIFSWLTFEGYVSACHASAATPVMVPTTADGGHDVDAILAAITDRTRVVLVASPNNPSGRPLMREQFDRLVAGVPPRVILALDEAYSEYASSPRAAFGASLFGDGDPVLPENVVILRTLSKAAALAGIRAGYALAAPRVIGGIAKLRTQLSVDRLAVAAAWFCFTRDGLDQIEDRVEWVKAERQRIERTLRDRMEKAEIEGRRHIAIPHSDGNFVWLPVGEKADELHATLLSDARILARSFPGVGLRYTVVEEDVNARFIETVTAWATTP